MLVFSDVDASGFLEDGLVIPVRVEHRQVVGDSVVFPHQDHLQYRQLRVLVYTDVTCEEKLSVGQCV